MISHQYFINMYSKAHFNSTTQQCHHNLSLLSEVNLASPFLMFFSFGHNLKTPVALYIVCKFHDEWNKETAKNGLEKSLVPLTYTRSLLCFSFSCKVSILEIRGFLPTAATHISVHEFGITCHINNCCFCSLITYTVYIQIL